MASPPRRAPHEPVEAERSWLPSGAVLIAANLVPLVAVLFLDWSVYSLLLLYWCENVVVGAFNVLRMAVAQGPDSKFPLSPKPFLIPFFMVHYGMCTGCS